VPATRIAADHRNPQSLEIIMNHIRHFAVLLAGLAATALTFAAASPAAFAMIVPPGGDTGGHAQQGPQTHTIITGGMAGWQITLIAAGAAVLAAVLAVLLDRTRVARRHQTTASA
jgi:hypothetical protein